MMFHNSFRRIGVVAAVGATAMVLSGNIAAATDSVTLAAGVNPFDGVVPDFTVFGAEFNNGWKKLLAGAWALAFVVVALGALRSMVELQRAKKGGYAAQVSENTESAKNSGWALLGLCALPLLVGAAIAIVP